MIASALWAPRAEAGVYNVIPANQFEEPTDSFRADDALFFFATSDIKGGTVCVVAATAGSAASCENPGWGSPNTVAGLGTIISLAEQPYLRIGTWKLIAETIPLSPQEKPERTAESIPFTVAPCGGSCNPSIASDIANEFKSTNLTQWEVYYDACTAMVLVSAFKSMQSTFNDAFSGKLLLDELKKKLKEKYDFETSYKWGFGSGSIAVSTGGIGVTFLPLTDVARTGEKKAIEILQKLTCTLGAAYADLANDPPDPIYAAVEGPTFRDVATLGDAQTDEVARSLDRELGFSMAMLTALERYQSAEASGDSGAVHRQTAALARNGFEMVDATRATVTSLREYAARLDTLSEFNEPIVADAAELASVQALYDRIKADGFTPAELDNLRSIGATEDEIAAIRGQFDVDFTGLRPGVTYQGYLNDIADRLLEQLAGIDRFARAAEAAASATDQPPTASFTGGRAPSGGALAMRFTDTSTSGDLDQIESVTWDFGDGSTGEGTTAEHTYAAGESYDVTMQACDLYACATTTRSITPGNQAPTAKFTSERDTTDPLLLRFDASKSADPDGDPLTYQWNFHDGTFGEGETVSHRFTRNGFRIVTLTVTDGTVQTSFIGNVHPGLQDPDARFEVNPIAALAPFTARFDASESVDPEGKGIVSYEWDFGDGTSGTGKTTSHLLATPGTRVVSLTITTSDGRTATTATQVFARGVGDLQLPVCGDQGDESEEPIVTKCPEFFPARGAQIFEVPGTGPRTITLDFVLKLGAFSNELAAFKVDDALGSIGPLKPGDAGYEAAAFARAQTIFPLVSGPATDDVTMQVTGGERFAFMLIAGATLDMVRQNPSNDPDTGPYAFFSMDQLNPDEIPHAVSYVHKTDGSVEFGFEDILGDSDGDFDDLVYRVSGLDPVPGLVVTKTADDPTSTAGETNGYTVTIANASGIDVPLESISDSLPAGFVYKSGSTSGAVPVEPAVSGGGRELRWNAPGIVPAGGSLRLHFDVTVANAAGEYLNEATAAAGGFAVEPSGPTAKVIVDVAPVNPPPAVNNPPVAEVKRSTDLVLGCSDRRVVLEDVFIQGKKIRLLGVAAREFAGRKVEVVFGATGKTVAEVRVGADGRFTATAPLPAKKLRNSNKARYVAKIGSDASLALKLARRMLVTKVAAAGNRVTIAGKVIGPLAARAKDRMITLQRVVACKNAETVRTFAPAKSGAFSVTVDAPAGQKAAVYRLSTRVLKNKRAKRLTTTFTLPRAVDFG